MDCTEMGAPPPTATDPTWIWRVSRRRAATGLGRAITASLSLSLEGDLHRARDVEVQRRDDDEAQQQQEGVGDGGQFVDVGVVGTAPAAADALVRSEEHTS